MGRSSQAEQAARAGVILVEDSDGVDGDVLGLLDVLEDFVEAPLAGGILAVGNHQQSLFVQPSLFDVIDRQIDGVKHRGLETRVETIEGIDKIADASRKILLEPGLIVKGNDKGLIVRIAGAHEG